MLSEQLTASSLRFFQFSYVVALCLAITVASTQAASAQTDSDGPVSVPLGIVGTHHLLVGQMLDEAGIEFQVSFDDDVCSTVSKNEVYKVLPSEGEVLASDNPLIVLRVLRSNRLVSVPDLMGLTLDAAKGVVEEQGLRFHDGGILGPSGGDWCGVYIDRTTSSDVREQEPQSGSLLACGEVVTGYKRWWGTWVSQRSQNGQCM